MVPCMLVGNKCDNTAREVTEVEGHRLAKQWNCAFIETSAKEKYHSLELFEQLLLLEKRRVMSLESAEKSSKKKRFMSPAAQRRADNIKDKCLIM